MEELISLWKNYVRASKRVPAATEVWSHVCGRIPCACSRSGGEVVAHRECLQGHFFYPFGCVDTCLHRCAFNTFIEQLFSME